MVAKIGGWQLEIGALRSRVGWIFTSEAKDIGERSLEQTNHALVCFKQYSDFIGDEIWNHRCEHHFIAQSLLAPGGRKWTATSDMASLGAKDGMKLTLIGKVPPSWRQLEVVAKAVAPLAAQAEGMAAEAAAATEGLALAEQLTKLLLKLDGVTVGDDAELRAARRQQVDVIQALLDGLEARRGQNTAR